MSFESNILKKIVKYSYEGNLIKIQKLFLENKHINIHSYEISLRISCENGNFQIAQWLLLVKPDIDISAFKLAFYSVCTFGNLEMAQWLYFINPNIISKKNEKNQCLLYKM